MLTKRKIKSRVKNKELINLRRQEIINAAVDLFVQNGFHKTTVRDITNRSGMSMGALYDYIRTKEDILYLVCDYIHETVGNKLRSVVSENINTESTIKKAIRDYIVIIDELQNYLLLLYQDTKSLNKAARKYIYKAELELTAIFENIIINYTNNYSLSFTDKQIKLIANNIMVLGHMWAFRRWILQKEYSLDEFIEYQTSSILNILNNNEK